MTQTLVANAVHTKESILFLLDTNPKAVVRALVVLFERQTADEQSSDETLHHNGRGFNGRDAEFGSSLAKQIIAFRPGRYSFPLSPAQLAKGRKMVRKYAGQLARVANKQD